jgi:membrane protein implicated in regulation of membrane protease activity
MSNLHDVSLSEKQLFSIGFLRLIMLTGPTCMHSLFLNNLVNHCVLLDASLPLQVSKLVKLVQQTSLLQAASLQLSSIWQSHSTAITSLAAAAATAGVYHLTYTAAACFVDMSAPGAAFACVGVSAAVVAGLWLYVRSGFMVDPERVYQVAMRKLTQHAGLQEVMGAPLAGGQMQVSRM